MLCIQARWKVSSAYDFRFQVLIFRLLLIFIVVKQVYFIRMLQYKFITTPGKHVFTRAYVE